MEPSRWCPQAGTGGNGRFALSDASLTNIEDLLPGTTEFERSKLVLLLPSEYSDCTVERWGFHFCREVRLPSRIDRFGTFSDDSARDPENAGGRTTGYWTPTPVLIASWKVAWEAVEEIRWFSGVNEADDAGEYGSIGLLATGFGGVQGA